MATLRLELARGDKFGITNADLICRTSVSVNRIVIHSYGQMQK